MKTPEELYVIFIRQISNNQKDVEGFFKEITEVAWNEGHKAGKKVINEVEEDYEPYFGWCDVDGCDNEGCSGGIAWRDTGYWTVCYKHSYQFRKGLEQPKMKQTAIDRENSRDKITGYLPILKLIKQWGR